MTVTGESISYEYRPMIESRINPSRKWSYKTSSPIFKKLYDDLVEVMLATVNRDKDMFRTVAGRKELILTYDRRRL